MASMGMNALPSPATVSPAASTRPTINTVNKNSTATLGGVQSNLLLSVCILILAATALLIAGRVVIKTARIA